MEVTFSLQQDLLTEDELASIAKTLCISRDNLASEGCDFIIFIAPNKERIYADELPDYYGDPADEHAVRVGLNQPILRRAI